MYFYIFPHIDLLKIDKKYFLVNLKKKTLSEITKNAYKVFLKCQKGAKVSKLAKNQTLLNQFLENAVKEGIGNFSNTFQKYKKPIFPNNKIDMVWLVLTNYCNYRCMHCYENASCQKKDAGLTIQNYKIFLDKLTKKFEVNCIQLTGGEPLSKGKKFIFELVDLIKKYNFKQIEIFTNLSILDEEYIKFFKENDICIATSFYSKTPEIHDKITGIKGSWQRTLNSLELLKENNIKFRVGIVIMKANQDDAFVQRNWLNKKFDLNETKLFDVVRPMGRGKNNEHVPTELFEEKFINKTELKHYDFAKYFYNKKFNSCWGNKICLKDNGKLYPCIMSSLELGDFKQIRKILSSRKSYRFLSKDKVNGCKKCKFKYLCSDCPAMHENQPTGLDEKPFTCYYNPDKNLWEEGEKNEN